MGCASSTTYKNQFAGVDEELNVQDYKTILENIKENKDRCYKEKDRILYYLDVGMLNHYSGNWRESNALLDAAEKSIEAAYTRSVSRATASMMLNDNVLEYQGEVYEDLYLNIFKALNYMRLDEFSEAMVEVRRISNKLKLLEDKNARFAKKYNQSQNRTKLFKPGHIRFHDSALARYISMIMYCANGDIDDARIDLERIKKVWKSSSQIYTFKMPSFATDLMPPPEGYTRLNVISFTGRLPYKYARALYIKTHPHSITVTETQQTDYNHNQVKVLDVIPWTGRKPLPPWMQMKFEVPYMKMRPSRVGSVRLMINNCELGRFSTIESMDKVAYEVFKVKQPLIYLKSVIRAAMKTVACAAAIKELRSHNDGQNIPPELVEMMFAATEHADLRVSRFFPASVGICEIDVPIGSYNLSVVYYDRNGIKIFTDDLGKVAVKAGKLNLLESQFLN